ncbi:MAG: hypothetical protein V4568_17925 [Pseudomonadota bacterium]
MKDIRMKTKSITPFANESETLAIGDLNIENREDQVSIYGSIDLTKDQEGFKKALALKEILDKVVDILKVEELPAKLSMKPAIQVKNPFKNK